MSTIAQRCRCGRMPSVRSVRSVGLPVETWVQCPGCGATGERIEDARPDQATAVDSWNKTGGRKL